MGKALVIGDTASVILRNRDKYLIYQRDNNPNIPWPNIWAFLGGHIEEGETPIEALRREIKEEINYSLPETHFVATLKDGTSRSHVHKSTIEKSLDELTLTEGEGQRLGYFPFAEMVTIVPQILKSFLLLY